MALQFNPPDWLIQEYMNRKSPAQQAADIVNQGVQGYSAYKEKQSQDQEKALGTSINAFKAGGPDLYAQVSKLTGLKNGPTVPGYAVLPQAAPQAAPDMPGMTPTEMQAQQSLPAEHPVIAHWNATMQPPAPAAQQNGLGINMQNNPLANVDQLANQGEYGKGKIDLGLKLQEAAFKNQEATAKSEENGPKSFDYARAYAANAGAPKAADAFIKLAQSEGRTTLSKRELDDVKNSIGASAQQGRGQYFGAMAGLNQAKFDNQLLQEGNKALNPNVAAGSLKPQQDRLNRIGRAEALVAQMKTQAGGGDTRQMQELATSLGSVLTGGNVVAQQQIEELVPQTYKGNFNKFVEKLRNNPTGLEQQAFVSRLADTLAREKGTINTQIQGAQQAALPSLAVLKQRNPQGYKSIVNSNVNNPAYGGDAGARPTVSSQQEYESLPSGTEYLSADGILHRKK